MRCDGWKAWNSALVLAWLWGLAGTEAGAQPATGWKFVQDSPMIFCTGSSCGPNNYQGNITPTVAGSVWILAAQGAGNHAITNVSGPTGTTWVHCPNCNAYNASGLGGSGASVDAWYALNGPANTTQGFTITMNGTMAPFFIELLPPPGTIASFDTSNVATPVNCSGTLGGTCAGPSLPSISGSTDAIYVNPGGAPQAQWNSVSAPWFLDANGGSVCLDCASGAAPDIGYSALGGTSASPEFFAIAFKSSAGMFGVPAPEFSIVQYTAPNTATTVQPPNGPTILCTSGVPCSLPLPQATTGAGAHLMFLASSNSGPSISNVTCTGASCPGWVIPTGSGSCQQSASANGSNYGLSCAYDTAIPSGVTALDVTMSGTSAVAFTALEVAATGAISFDQQNDFTAPSGTEFITAPVMSTPPITNDFIVQLFLNSGGSLGSEYYGLVYNLSSFNYFDGATASIAVLPNSGASPPPVTWINCCFTKTASNTFGSGIAFKSTGGSVPDAGGPDAGPASDAGGDAGAGADSGCPCDGGTPPADAGLGTDSGSTGSGGDAGSVRGGQATGGCGCGSSPGALPALVFLASIASFAAIRTKAHCMTPEPPGQAPSQMGGMTGASLARTLRSGEAPDEQAQGTPVDGPRRGHHARGGAGGALG